MIYGSHGSLTQSLIVKKGMLVLQLLFKRLQGVANCSLPLDVFLKVPDYSLLLISPLVEPLNRFVLLIQALLDLVDLNLELGFCLQQLIQLLLDVDRRVPVFA